MNDKVIIAKASDATAERLYRFVKKINDNTSIRAYWKSHTNLTHPVKVF